MSGAKSFHEGPNLNIVPYPLKYWNCSALIATISIYRTNVNPIHATPMHV